MDDAYVEHLREPGPVGGWRGEAAQGREFVQRGLDEMADEAGIGAVRDDRRRRVRTGTGERGVAQGVIGRRAGFTVGQRFISAGPGFDAGVDIQDVVRLAPVDQCQRGYLDREVDEHVAGVQAFGQQRGVVVLGHGDHVVIQSVAVSKLPAVGVGAEDGDVRRAAGEVCEQQGH